MLCQNTGGLLREFLRECLEQNPNALNTTRAVDGQNGVDFILTVASRYGPRPEQTNLQAMRDVFRFGQLPGELIESPLTRLDLVLHRGRTYSGLQLSEQALAFFLLDRLRVSEHSFPFILQQLGGRLPTTPEESVVFP